MASERVLLIEDDPSIVAGLELNLALEGYEVLTAADGERGYRLAIERNPDLIVLDIMLPGMNGLEVLRRLREVDADVPVLVLTARGEEADKVLGLTLGADDYISKPFSLRELVARVRAVLRRGAPEPTRAAAPVVYRGAHLMADFEAANTVHLFSLGRQHDDRDAAVHAQAFIPCGIA